MSGEWTVDSVQDSDELNYMARIGARFFEEGNLPGRIVPAVFVATWTKFIEAGLGEIYALKRDGEIVGALGGVVTDDPNDGVRVGSELFWWVMPECRGHGVLLLKEFEGWAMRKGAKRLAMVHLLSLMPEKVGKLYERMGYKAVEVNYHKELCITHS